MTLLLESQSNSNIQTKMMKFKTESFLQQYQQVKIDSRRFINVTLHRSMKSPIHSEHLTVTVK